MRTKGVVSMQDVARLGKLLAGGFAATILPVGLDDEATNQLMARHPATRLDSVNENARRMEDALSSLRKGDWNAIAQQQARMNAENYWGRYRGVGLRGWHPHIEFHGEETVRAALRARRGVIAWCMRFASDIVIKQGFFQVQLPLAHLSGAGHGAQNSETAFATTLISPLYRRAEDRYLADRVIIPTDGSLGYLQKLRENLRANRVVSIFGDPTGRQVAEVPFLGRTNKFATGAPSIAWTEECALLPVHAIRTGRFRYRVVVQDPIPVDRSMPRKEFAKSAVGEFARRMEQLVIQHPSDWQDWGVWGRTFSSTV